MSCTFCVAIYLSIKLYLKFIGSMYGGGGVCVWEEGCWLMGEVSDRDSMQIRLGMSGLACSKLVLPL